MSLTENTQLYQDLLAIKVKYSEWRSEVLRQMELNGHAELRLAADIEDYFNLLLDNLGED